MIGLIYLEVLSLCRPFEEELCRNKDETARIKVPKNYLHHGRNRTASNFNKICLLQIGKKIAEIINILLKNTLCNTLPDFDR